jgi:3-oxoadipate enol-lactonase
MHARKVFGRSGVGLACHLGGDPDAPPMVLLHALGEQANNWDAVLPAFEPFFRVAALDLRGHGASDWPGAYSFELMRDDVLDAVDELKMHQIVLVGHSMGGAPIVGRSDAAARKLASRARRRVRMQVVERRPVDLAPSCVDVPGSTL